MADSVDIAHEYQQLQSEIALHNSRKATPDIVPNGECFNCGNALINPIARWCNAQCRDEWCAENE